MGLDMQIFREASDFTTTATSPTIITDAQITLNNEVGGKCIVSQVGNGRNSNPTGNFTYHYLYDDGSSVNVSYSYYYQNNQYKSHNNSQIMDTDGSVMDAYLRANTNTAYWRTDSSICTIEMW